MTGFLLTAALVVTAPASPPDFVASGPADEPTTGALVSLGPDGTAEVPAADGTVAVRNAYALRRAPVPVPAFPRGPVLITTTGDRLPGRLVGGDDRALRSWPESPTSYAQCNRSGGNRTHASPRIRRRPFHLATDLSV